MFRHALVPLDGSPSSRTALAPLRRLLNGAEGGRALLLRALPSPEANPESARQAMDAVAAEVAAWPEAASIEVEVALEAGDPAEVILAAAERSGADLIAMATHGRGGWERMIRGSVAERVLRTSPVPLLLVNSRSASRAEEAETAEGEAAETAADGFARILVPLDGSSTADAALPYAIALAQAYGASLTLLRVEPVEPYLADPLVGVPFVEQTPWSPDAVAKTLEPQRQRVADAGIPVEVRAVMGNAAGEILTLAHEHDLVVLSSHGRSGLSRWWFGSVAEQVLRRLERPLLLLRPRES